MIGLTPRYTTVEPVQLTNPSSAHVKSVWTELLASTPFDAQGFYLWFRSQVARVRLIDIGVGGAGSEQVILPNVLLQQGITERVVLTAYVPLPIPAGSRLAARLQADTTGALTFAGLTLLGVGGHPVAMAQARDYGTNTGTTRGTSIDPGNSVGSKGLWSQLVASTTWDIRWLLVFVGNGQNALDADAHFDIDLGVGGAGSEQIILPDLPMEKSDVMSACILQSLYGGFPVTIPAGSRLAARAKSTTADATDRLFDLSVIGVG